VEKRSGATRSERRESRGVPQGVRAWLEEFAAAVRAADTARGRVLFDPGVLGFGTVARRADGLDRLVEDQWRTTWAATTGFDFAWDDVRVGGDDEETWVAAPWASTGFDAMGRAFPRRGRATLVLRRGADGAWRALHTHFSLDPAPAPEA
jgi:ketosteroid isomerase-like protein